MKGPCAVLPVHEQNRIAGRRLSVEELAPMPTRSPPQWKAYIAERYGTPPDIRYFETAVVVDNESDKIDEAA
jgi:hypothetical protein